MWSIVKIVACTLLLQLVAKNARTQTVLVPDLIEASTTRAGNHLTTLFEDSRGFIWAGTMLDLIRYDGFSIKRYNYASIAYEGELIITSITEDPNGNIWCCSRTQGLLVLPFSKTGFGKLTIPQLKGDKPKPKMVSCDKEGNIWGLTINDEIFLLQKGDSSFFTWPLKETGPILSLMVDPKVGIWYVPTRGGIYYCKSPAAGTKLQTTKVYNDRVGNAIICDDGIYFYETKNLYKISFSPWQKFSITKLAVLPSKNTLKENRINHMAALSSAPFVLAITSHSQLLLINKTTGEIVAPQLENINTARIEYISPLIVSDKLVYIGTNKGLLRATIGNKAFSGYTDNQNPKFRCITALGTDTLLLGTSGLGVLQYIKNKAGKWNPDLSVNVHDSTSINGATVNRFYCDSKGIHWAATNSGLFMKEKNGWQLTTKSVSIWGVTEDKEGNLWLGSSQSGLVRYNPTTGKSKSFLPSKKTVESQADKHYKLIWQVKYHNEKIYLATAAGMLEFDIKTEKFKVIFNQQLKLVPSWDFFISDTIWLIPTEGKGLWTYRPQTGKLEIIESANNFFYSTVQDGNGDFWMLTDKGTARFQWPAEVSIFTTSDGLNTDYLSYTGIAKLGNKQMAFCGEDGFTIINIDSVGTNNSINQGEHLFVSSLKYAGIQVSDFMDSAAAIELDFAKGQLLIEWATGYMYPQKTTLYYILEGEDENWNTTNNNGGNIISYTNLRPGTYVFKAYLTDKNTKNRKSYSITILIRPPFWLTLWFKVLIATILSGILFYVIYEWATRQKLKQAKLKSEIEALRAQINPHFIFNALNSIQSFIYLENKGEANEYLSKFARLMRLILENSREEIITIQQEMVFLNIYLEMEMLRFKGNITYTVIADKNCAENLYKIPSMLIQPLVENSLKHGINSQTGKLNLDIRFGINNNVVTCEVIDNGMGFFEQGEKTTEGKSRSLGLKLVQERLQTLSKIYKKEYKIIIGNRQDYLLDGKGAYIKLIIPQYD